MESLLLSLLRCPACAQGKLSPASSDGPREDPTVVACTKCGERFYYKGGILDLNPDPSEAARAEMDAHETIEAGWLESIPEDLRRYVTGENGVELMRSLPHVNPPELADSVPSLGRIDGIAEDFFELLDWLALRGGEVIVEVGAHLGWCSYRLAQRGTNVVATDISHQLALTDSYVAQGIAMERLFCDMHVFPFRDDCLDYVISVATVHHSHDLDALFRHFRRALKPGGKAVLFSEPVAGRWDRTVKATFGAEEKALGVQEHIYTINEYVGAAKCAGLTPHVIPHTSILRESTRRYGLLRWLWLLAIRIGLGYRAPFTRVVYPLVLQFYPKIPFPHFSIILSKP